MGCVARFLIGLVTLITFATALFSLAVAQDTPQAPAAAEEEEAPRSVSQVPLDVLLDANGDLPDIVIGKDDAPVTIVEYASLSCSHCANFHKDVFPDLKSKYLDTGKAKLIVREFPTSERALVAHMLTRCVSPEKAPGLLSELFHAQEDWAFSDGDPTGKLKSLAGKAGLSAEQFETCTKDQALFDKMVANFTAAGEKFGINATPTFFIDGKLVDDAATMETFDRLLSK